MVIHNPTMQGRRAGGLSVEAGMNPYKVFIDPANTAPYVIGNGFMHRDAYATWGEFGLSAEAGLNDLGTHGYAEYFSRMQELITSYGIPTPHTYSLRELVLSPEEFPAVPVVVKDLRSDRGMGKCIVRSSEQLLNFLVWHKLKHFLIHAKSPDERGFLEEVFEVKQQIISNLTKWDGVTHGRDPWFDRSTRQKYSEDTVIAGLTAAEAMSSEIERDFIIVEEQVIGPIDGFATSIRVVANALGEIEYSQLHINAMSTTNNPLPDDFVWEETKIYEGEDDPQVQARLFHPSSPLHIPKTLFVSNRSQGAAVAVLQSKHVNPRIVSPDTDALAEILSAHRISPDTRELPEFVEEASKQIGFDFKFFFPFVGIDFIVDQAGNWFILEVNSGPDLNPRAMGADYQDPGESHARLVRSLIERVAQKSV